MRRGRVQARDARVLRIGRAESRVGAERLEQLPLEKRADRLAGDAPEKLARVQPERQGVVPLPAPRFPRRELLLDRPPDDVRAIAPQAVVDRDRRVERQQPRAVVAERTNGDPLLPRRRKGGPVRRHRLVPVELAAIGQHVERHRRETFGDRKDDDARVVDPGATGLEVGKTAPEIEDTLAAVEDAQPCADLGAVAEVQREALRDRLEAGGIGAQCGRGGVVGELRVGRAHQGVSNATMEPAN